MSTRRIDSENELQIWLYELEMKGIEIPVNVSIQIDSPILKKALIDRFLIGMALSDAPFAEQIELKNFMYMGVKLTFKSE